MLLAFLIMAATAAADKPAVPLQYSGRDGEAPAPFRFAQAYGG